MSQAAQKSASIPKETAAVSYKVAPKESAIPKKKETAAAAVIAKKDASSVIPKNESAIPKKELEAVWGKEIQQKGVDKAKSKKGTATVVRYTVVPEVSKHKETAQVEGPQKTQKRKPEPKQVNESHLKGLCIG